MPLIDQQLYWTGAKSSTFKAPVLILMSVNLPGVLVYCFGVHSGGHSELYRLNLGEKRFLLNQFGI